MYNKRFKNPYKKNIHRSIFHYLLWFFGFYNDYKQNKVPILPKDFIYPNPKEEPKGEYRVTWVNHSTFLIKAEGLIFITDPIFKNRCSPFSFIGPRRCHPAKP